MNIEKKKTKFLKRLRKANIGDTVTIIKFKRKHFNDTLSTQHGFGFQDMKEGPKDFYRWLMNLGYDFKTNPTNINSPEDFGVVITLIKDEEMSLIDFVD
jgi:hypothetical protein